MIECDRCGICCRNIGGIKELSEFLLDDGSCINLDKESNLCKIYDQRPKICRVKEMFDDVYSKFMSADEYINLNTKSCEILKKIYKKG